MRRGGRFPSGQAEIVFSDALVEQLEALDAGKQLDVLAEVVALCGDPGGKHPLAGPLAGWNTVEVLRRHSRVVYRASIVDGVGVLEALCLGPRSDSEVYDMARALRASGLLEPDELTELWDALAILGVVEEAVGLDGWDYRPPLAPEGMRRAAVAAGIVDQATAAVLSKDELEAAMSEGWTEHGPDVERALAAALNRARAGVAFSSRQVVRQRGEVRCNAVMPKARAHCIRRLGHPGPHRST